MAEPRCPACGSRQVGQVGASQYYCWECCIEFTLGRREPRLFRVDPEGVLLPYRGPQVAREGCPPKGTPGRRRHGEHQRPEGDVTGREGG
ncbi:MAG: hypothetical protein K6T75_03390 [Acetobacteraceae bacterium]|nr:hypothetical protein [Acetobacteraceae bacterium]